MDQDTRPLLCPQPVEGGTVGRTRGSGKESTVRWTDLPGRLSGPRTKGNRGGIARGPGGWGGKYQRHELGVDIRT